jgi:hypothetical protein
MQKMINFNNPVITGNKFPNYMKLSKLKHYSANGYFTKKCQQWAAEQGLVIPDPEKVDL